MQDPIADMITRVRNALMAKHKEVSMPSSKQKIAIANVLKDEGYIVSYSVSDDNSKPTLTIVLKYFENASVIKSIKRASRPGLRTYKGYNDIAKVSGGFGISIISTSAGVVSDRQARKNKLGGEVWVEVC